MDNLLVKSGGTPRDNYINRLVDIYQVELAKPVSQRLVHYDKEAEKLVLANNEELWTQLRLPCPDNRTTPTALDNVKRGVTRAISFAFTKVSKDGAEHIVFKAKKPSPPGSAKSPSSPQSSVPSSPESPTPTSPLGLAWPQSLSLSFSSELFGVSSSSPSSSSSLSSASPSSSVSSSLLVPSLVGEGVLEWALKEGRLSVVQLLGLHGGEGLLQGWRNPEGESALHVAAASGQGALLSFLLREAALPLEAKDGRGRTPLLSAIRAGQSDAALALLRCGANPEATDAKGTTPLLAAARRGLGGVAGGLLRQFRARPSVPSLRGTTALHVAAKRGDRPLAEGLLAAGANPRAAHGQFGDSPLHWAARHGQGEVLDLLLRHESSPNSPNALGHSPLHCAVLEGREEAVAVLLRHGADVQLPLAGERGKGQLPLHLASQCGVARLLLQFGAPVDAQDGEGNSALHWASKWGQAELAQLLLKHGADAFLQNRKGNTPLHFAALDGQEQEAKLLLEHEAALPQNLWNPRPRLANLGNLKGNTPLHLASSAAVARVLLEGGADPYALNARGESVLSLAEQRLLASAERGEGLEEKQEVLLLLQPYMPLSSLSPPSPQLTSLLSTGGHYNQEFFFSPIQV